MLSEFSPKVIGQDATYVGHDLLVTGQRSLPAGLDQGGPQKPAGLEPVPLVFLAEVF